MNTLIKSFIFSLVLFLSIQLASAQKYKVKGEAITKDDLPMGTVTGKSGLSKSNFIINGLAGEKVISVYRDEYKAPNLLFKDRYWYNVRFEDTGKEFFLPMAVEFSVKAVLNKTFPAAEIIIDGGLIKNQDAIIAKYDITDSIIRDTTYMGARHRAIIADIKELPLQSRDIKKEVSFQRRMSETINDTTFTRWSIYQDGVWIGNYEQRSYYLFNKDNYTYVIYRRTSNQANNYEVPIAFGEPDTFNTAVVKFTTLIDKKARPVNMPPGADLSVVYALISGFYL